MGTINGNGSMPFPHVALIEPVINAWHQLVVTKTADGFQKFHHNGVLVHSDHASAWAPKVWPLACFINDLLKRISRNRLDAIDAPKTTCWNGHDFNSFFTRADSTIP